MIYKPYKNIKLSCLGMGNMRLPVTSDIPGTPIDRNKAQEIIDYAIKSGINYFDTAYVYHDGESEKFLGDALSKYPRESYYLATKFFIMANPDYKAVFEEQLEHCKTDYFDFYLIHAIFDHTYQQYIDSGCIEYFLEQQKAGRIKYLGFSSHAKPDNMRIFAEHHQWDFAQIQLNYYDWKFSTAKEEYEILTKLEIPVMVMEPVRGGRLASLDPETDKMLKNAQPDKSISSWAFRWLLGLTNVQVILSGMSCMEQIEDNVATFSERIPLTEAEEKVLMEVCDLFHKQLIVPCTVCRYCCDGCPKQIDIPQILTIYNKFKLSGTWALQDLKGVEEGKSATDCINCGACTGHCPQSINISLIMKELSDALAAEAHS